MMGKEMAAICEANLLYHYARDRWSSSPICTCLKGDSASS